MTAHELSLLVVDDNRLVARAWMRQLQMRDVGDVRTAHSVREAKDLLDAHPRFGGALLDYKLPDGTGLDLVDTIRAQDPATVIILATGEVTDDAFTNRVQARGVMLGKKPLGDDNIDAFIGRALVAQRIMDRQMVLRSLSDKGLTERQQQVLRVVLRAESRAAAAAELGVSLSSVKASVAAILFKCDVAKLNQLACELLEL